VTGATIPATLLWAVRLLYLECAGLAALTAYLVVLAFTSDDVHVGMALALIAFTVIGVVAVFFLARGLSRLVRGTRGPAIVVQLFAIATGGFLVQVDPLWLGLALLALGALTGLLIVLPPSNRALGVG
jgi:hypothetical protein